MTLMADRFGFGCGRIQAGFSESASARLVHQALDCGIRYFDTAPSYGGGASERILGRCVQHVRREVEICTKIGLARGHTYFFADSLRAAVRLMGRPAARTLSRWFSERHASAAAIREYGDFYEQLLKTSLEESLRELRTDYVDCLLLHEPRLNDPPSGVAAQLRAMVGDGITRRVGVGTGRGLDELPAFGEVAQCRLGHRVIESGEQRQLIVHGIFRNLDLDKLRSSAAASGLWQSKPDICQRYLNDAIGAGTFVAIALLTCTQTRRILVSTSSRRTLRNFALSATRLSEELTTSDEPCNTALLATLTRYVGSRG